MARAPGGQIKKKKGEAGAAKNYITRTQAIKKLQCSISDFRRLCILKGIYPRQPRNTKKANKGSTAPASFYYVKDIQYLLHEPVLQKLRDHKSFAKKLSRAIGRGEWAAAKSLEDNKKPKYRLDHIIKERYPSFPDALRDLDDALSLIILFAHLPASEKIPASVIANCSKLAAEWQLYVMRTKTLKKVFLSVKGIYFQAQVKGETVTWLVPYMFTQNIPSDIDFRIMLTFLELYQTLLGFVFFKLYSDVNLIYPPKLDTKSDDEAAGIGALLLEETSRTLTIEGKKGTEEGIEKDLKGGKKVTAKDVKKQIRSLTHHQSGDAAASTSAAVTQENEDTEMVAEPSASTSGAVTDVPVAIDAGVEGSDALPQAEADYSDLFNGYYFYLSREVTRPTLEFIIRSFGGAVGWDPILGAGSPFKVDDARITHHIIDRPVVPSSSTDGSNSAITIAGLPNLSSYPGKRAYIQPQWVVDCVNFKKLLPTDPYAPGSVLPPHLSPFVDEQKVREQGGYIPVEAGGEAITAAAGEAAEEEESQEDQEEEMEGVEGEDDEDEEEFKGFGADEDAEEETAEEEEVARPALLAAAVNPTDSSLLHAAEFEAESLGLTASTFASDLANARKALLKSTSSSSTPASAEASTNGPATASQTQESNPASILLSNKQRKLYNKMKFGENKRNIEADKLREKKLAIVKEEQQQEKEERKGGKKSAAASGVKRVAK